MKASFIRIATSASFWVLLTNGCGSGLAGETGAPGGSGSGGAPSGSPANNAGTAELVKSALARVAPVAGAEAAASTDIGDFGWAFYRQASDATANFVYSPYSINIASAMLSAGAAGNTLAEIQAALHFSATAEPLHIAENALAQALSQRNREASSMNNAQTLRVSNDLWMIPELDPSQEFLDPLAQYYGTGVFLAPFATAPDTVRRDINGKVSSDTNGLIDELLPMGSITTNTVFVLTNALYFKSRWASTFVESATVPGPFTAIDGTVSDVPMMHQVEFYPYAAADGYQALSLPYDRGELEMVFVLPDAGNFESLVTELDSDTFATLTDSLMRRRLELALPKFRIEAELPLKQELIEAGMVEAFTPGANFPLIGSVMIDDAFHQATLIVDEEGTEAAAATAFVGVPTSAPIDEPLPVALDRPFIFAIRDVATRAILFLGHYVTVE